MLKSLCQRLRSTNTPRQHHAILASNVISLDNITLACWNWPLRKLPDKPKSYIKRQLRKPPDKTTSSAQKLTISASSFQPCIQFGVSICHHEGGARTEKAQLICFIPVFDSHVKSCRQRIHNFVPSYSCATELAPASHCCDNAYYWQHILQDASTISLATATSNPTNHLATRKVPFCARHCNCATDNEELILTDITHNQAGFQTHMIQTTAIDDKMHELSCHFLIILSAWLLHCTWCILLFPLHIYGSHLTAAIFTKASRVLSQGLSKLSLQRSSRHCDILYLIYI